MGHSWGTYLGLKTIEKYPENYLAYFGIGQVSNQVESEIIAYDYMLQHAIEINDKEAVEKFKMYDKDAPDFPSFDYLMIRSLYMNKYGVGMTRQYISMVKLFKMILSFKGYTFSEKINYARGSMFSMNVLFNHILHDNLCETSVSFDVPICITHGKYDYQVSYDLAKEYFDKIETPEKTFVTFENAAHSPIIEEPEKFIQTVREFVSKHPCVTVQ
jgi:pimeloyl-ACP methyl ester carboxylesterase